jgi:predicted nucleic acid-binding protein
LVTATRDGLKAMDSVHVAIAAQHGCERFVTNSSVPTARRTSATTTQVGTKCDSWP